MKNNTLKFLVVSLFVFCLTVNGFAQQSETRKLDNGNVLSIKDVGSILLPAEMEVFGGVKNEINQAIAKKTTDIKLSLPNSFDFQQKDSGKTTAGIRFGTLIKTPGTYAQMSTKPVFQRSELVSKCSDVKSLLDETAEELGSKLIRFDGCSNSPVNKVYAFKYSYISQSGSNPPEYFETHYIDNNDRTHVLTISYREKDSALWKPIMEAVKNSLVITNIRK